MRVLVCQNPRLTYVQAIELLQRETFGLPVDLALLPEMALEHPPQCTGQGDLTQENVAFLMLTRYAKEKHMYIVLGSVEERTEDGRTFDTCVVINKQGELFFFYRKQSSTLQGKAAGTEPGIFETEFGTVGIMLGSEIEEELRWLQLLSYKPYLILNPARAPMQMDPVLIHSHPQLQVSAWHQGFRRLEHIVETRTRQYPCSFVRADAPFQDGGAGTSLLVEPHRSVLAPRWGTAFFVVDTLHPYELEGRKLPGWRQLTIDERARLAAADRALLTHEEIERGPRYLVWTLRASGVGGLRGKFASWSVGSKASSCLQNVLSDAAQVNVSKRQAFLVPCMKDSRATYTSITSKGLMSHWDIKLKRELSSSSLGSTSITAVSSWKYPSQFAVVSSTRKQVSLRIYDYETPIAGLCIDDKATVRVHRKHSVSADTFGRRRSSIRMQNDSRRKDAVSDMLSGARMASVMSVHHIQGNSAILVFEPADSDKEVTAKVVDLDDGSAEEVDIYGLGPPSYMDEDEEESEEAQAKPVTIDKLVHTQIVELQQRASEQSALMCFYESHRICHLALDDHFLHEQMLLEDGATERLRADTPVTCVVLPSSSHDAYHMIVSYSSMALRWWLVSLTQCKLIGHTTVTSLITHLAIVDWPSSAGAGAQQATGTDKHEKFLPALQTMGGLGARKSIIGFEPVRPSSGSPRPATGPPRALRDRFRERTSIYMQGGRPEQPASAAKPVELQKAVLHGRPSVKVVDEVSESRRTSLSAGRASVAPSVQWGNAPRASIKGRRSCIESATSKLSSMRLSRHSVMSVATEAAVEAQSAEELMSPKDHGCLLIVAFDVQGGMPLFLARSGRISKVYTCSDHFVDKSAKVEQLLCDGVNVAVQLSNGDIRHFEFIHDNNVIKLTEVPMESNLQ